MDDKSNRDFEIIQVKRKHEEGIVKLLFQSFSGKDIRKQKRLYKFLNYENPAQKKNITGLVAIKDNIIIGYLGFVVLPFLFGSKRLKILIPHSIATHIHYRRKGISKRIFEKSLDLFDNDYSFFLGTSFTKLSILGRIKQKWIILGKKDYLYMRHFSINRNYKKNDEIIFKEEVPSEIINIIFKNSIFSDDIKIRIDLSSIDFINWIFNRDGFKWAVLKKNSDEIAYCCFYIKGNHCNLIHFDMINFDSSLNRLLDEIAFKYSIKSFYYYSSNKKSLKRKILRKVGFWSTNISLVRKILKKELLPILFRPTQKVYDSSYFFIDNIETKDIENWDITKLSNF